METGSLLSFHYTIILCFPKNARLNPTDYFIKKLHNKHELQQIVYDFMEI